MEKKVEFINEFEAIYHKPKKKKKLLVELDKERTY